MIDRNKFVQTENSPRYRAYTPSNIQNSPYWFYLKQDLREALLVLSQVLPFKTNEYVLSELIDWSKVPDDPIYRLNFPHPDMLSREHYSTLYDALFTDEANITQLSNIVKNIRHQLNPHPAGQLSHNIPIHNGQQVQGVQHKYQQTVLFFPSSGQTCHAYCTFCFRWPQFVNDSMLRIEAKNTDQLINYLKEHLEVTDVLITGGDPLTMSTKSLSKFIAPLLEQGLEHIRNIRIGTKSLVYWPQRFTSDPDADDLLKLFERIVNSGKHLAIMAHINHPIELSTTIAEAAARRIIATGAVIRLQSPIVKHINDSEDVWIKLWTTSVSFGMVPYYMFIERDTGPKDYFKVPLAQALQIFNKAYQAVSGLARTVRGPSMSTFIGKVLINGTLEIEGKKAFALQVIQARRPENVGQIFLAQYDESASWLDELHPFDSRHNFPTS